MTEDLTWDELDFIREALERMRAEYPNMIPARKDMLIGIMSKLNARKRQLDFIREALERMRAEYPLQCFQRVKIC